MPRATHAIGALCLGLVVATGWTAAAPAAGVDAAFRTFFDAKSPQDADRAVSDIVQSGITFEDALVRLKRGRTYRADAPRGIVRLSRQSGGEVFYYDLNIPDSYDPSRKYQVRINLHGGVGASDVSRPRGSGSIGALAGAEQIYIMPYAWADAKWWTNAQIDNLRAILDSVKRTYDVDENRVALAGVSDGATGTYYFAMRDTTPYASFLSLNGYFRVLNNPSVEAEGELFTNNFLNKPFFLVNGGADPLYPTRIVDPYVQHLQNGGLTLEYWPQPEAGHNTAWWPEVKDRFEAFVHDHPREPLPQKLTWESTGDTRASRAHWLIIDHLAASPALPPLRDLNDRPPSSTLLDHSSHFGRVDLVRTGNTVEATTRGVTEFTLLVSPDAFDLAQPIRVVTNGHEVFNDRITPSVATLVKWAARDNDRTTLFAAELHIKPIE